MAMAIRHYLFDDRETQANALVIHLSRSEKLTESWEQFTLVLLGYANARVSNMPN